MRKILLLFAVSIFFFSCSKKQNSAPGTLPDPYANQALGSSAHDMLSADKFTGIDIQVQYMPGYPLDTAAITDLTTYLNSLCNKPGGVSVSQTQTGPNGDTLTVDKVAVLEARNRTLYNTGNTLALYILVTDGYDTGSTILGFAYRSTSICLFGKNIYDHSGGTGQLSRVKLEASVLEHELGHIMGLVNLGTPMVTAHQDTQHGPHCDNPKCLMYYAIELHTGFGSVATIPLLDSNCRNDLHANGGR